MNTPPLEARLKARILAEGPISVVDYMAEANAHYYATRDPFGVEGDFTTAPEISQMFGELIGVWLADLWQRAGRPAAARYVELGPGRGTLAEDALRAMRGAGLAPPVELVETSPTLRAAQAERVPARWHDALATLPGAGPLLVVANEFFDALPVRQFEAGRELRIGWQGGFVRDGAVETETSPAALALAADLARRLAAQGGAALIVDYGHDRPGTGDTLQAVSAHEYADPFAEPGERDLTAHVDFRALAQAARGAGVRVFGPVAQGAWLQAMGIKLRAASLAKAAPERAPEIAAARARLTAPEQMGRLFKAMALVAPGWPEPAGFEMAIAYRDATPADAPLMAELGPRSFTETFGHLYSPENLAAFLVNHNEDKWRGELSDPAFAVRLAEEDDEAIGFAKLGPPSLPFAVTGPAAELRQLYVLGPWQGAGVARVLMGWVLAEARRRGAGQLYLSVFTDNHRARHFYARHGFEEVGPYAFMVGTHADEDIIMRLKL